MKVAIINFSGNVGKSTIARHLFAPRLNTEVISVESINADEGGTQVRGDQFRFVQEHLLENDTALIDIGASNIEDFVAGMSRYKSSHEDIDLFVVPVVKETKQQKDTIATIEALNALGVPAKKIRVVFNRVDTLENIEEQFSAIVGYAEAEKKCTIKANSVIYQNELFEEIKKFNKTVSEIAADPTDYRAQIKTAKDAEEKDFFIQMTMAKRLAVAVNENLDTVYKVLTK